MASIKSGNNANSGGGGGSITGFQLDSVSQTTAYASGAVTLVLTRVPFSQAGMIVNLNGQILKQGTDWTFAGSTITFLVENPYLTVSDPPDIFTCQYPY